MNFELNSFPNLDFRDRAVLGDLRRSNVKRAPPKLSEGLLIVALVSDATDGFTNTTFGQVSKWSQNILWRGLTEYCTNVVYCSTGFYLDQACGPVESPLS